MAVFINNRKLARLPLGPTDYVPIVQDWTTHKTPLTDLFPFPSFLRVEPLSGDTITATDGLGAFHIAPAGLITGLTMVLPPNPVNGQIFEASTSEDIVGLMVTAPGGATLAGNSSGPFTLAQNGGTSWRFDLSRTEWFPRF